MNIDQHYDELRKVASRHRRLTGNTISGLTGELGEYFASKLLKLRIARKNNNPGYDAIRGKTKVQIKTGIPVYSASNKPYWQFSHVSTSHNWNIIVFVFLTIRYEVKYMYCMSKTALRKAQTVSAKKHSSITGTQVMKFGERVYPK